MDSLDVAERLRRCSLDLPKFTPRALAEFFALPIRHFNQAEPDGPVFFHPACSTESAAYLIRGSIFWPGERRIIRGHPRVFPTSDYTSDRYQTGLEPRLAQAAHEGEVIVEPKVFGATIRVYKQGSDLYCATDVSHDGGNPLVSAGIDNSRALGIDYGSQAARILSSQYPKIERLARLDYVAVFVLQLPEFAPDHSVDRSDLILVDMIDPEHCFVDRLEKERIAEDYGLNIVDLAGKITVARPDPMAFVRRCRAMEHQAAQLGSAGFVIKGRIGDGDQLLCKVEPISERDRLRDISSGDLAAVTEEIAGQFGDEAWSDDLFIEDILLEYLGTRHRSARWRVQEYVAAWRQARRAIGLA